MSKLKADVNPVFFNNLNHSLAEWLTNRANRATFAVTSFMSVLLATVQGSIISKDDLNEMIGYALQSDTIYVLQMDKDIVAFFISDEKALLTRFTPSSEEAFFEILPIKNYGEERTNEILDSMIIKRTINSYYHVEAEEFAVINEIICGSMNPEAVSVSDENTIENDHYHDDEDYEDNRYYDGEPRYSPSYYMDGNTEEYDTEEYDSDYYNNDSDYCNEPEYGSRDYLDDDGRFYDEESWYETHLNPPGTTDCGDGYIDADGVFSEY